MASQAGSTLTAAIGGLVLAVLLGGAAARAIAGKRDGDGDYLENKPDGSTLLQLQSIERVFEHNPATIVHTMAVSGHVAVLVQYAEDSWRKVVARHPRMRARLLNNHTAHIAPPPPAALPPDRVAPVQVLDHTSKPFDWHAFADERCHAPRPPAGAPLFAVTVVRTGATAALLVLTSDHTVSDGASGYAILHDYMMACLNAAAAATTTTAAAAALAPLPLEPPFYARAHRRAALAWRALTTAVAAVTGAAMSAGLRRYRPLLPLEPSQRSMASGGGGGALPLPRNRSAFVFASGAPEALVAATKRCHEEGVTMNGAITVAILMALTEARRRIDTRTTAATTTSNTTPWSTPTAAASGGSASGRQQRRQRVIGAVMDTNYNLRARVAPPVPADAVGCYVLFASLGTPRYTVPLSACFWDAARAARAAVNAAPRGLIFAATAAFLHRHLDSQAKHLALLGWLPASVASDCNISNIGRYPYPLELHASGSRAPTIRVHSVHVNTTLPSLAPSVQVVLTATDRMHYTVTHKLEGRTGADVAVAIRDAIESLGAIGAAETVAEAGARAFGGGGGTGTAATATVC